MKARRVIRIQHTVRRTWIRYGIPAATPIADDGGGANPASSDPRPAPLAPPLEKELPDDLSSSEE